MKSRILIVEDEKPLREAFAFLLETEGYEIGLAENGQVALQRLEGFNPHLIILDMLMPVMNGQEFLHEADRFLRKQKAKVLMLSNLSDPIAVDDAADLGVTDSVLKADLSPVELAAKVKKILFE